MKTLRRLIQRALLMPAPSVATDNDYVHALSRAKNVYAQWCAEGCCVELIDKTTGSVVEVAGPGCQADECANDSRCDTDCSCFTHHQRETK